MSDQDWLAAVTAAPAAGADALKLRDGSRVAVVGGGPAGSFFAYYLLDLSARVGLSLDLELYEPRDYSKPGGASCNMCGGIISESLVQNLAADGINLPETVIQRGIDAYLLHTDKGSVRIETPLQEKRIGAVHRGAGPRDLKPEEVRWSSFDGHLLSLAAAKGARIRQERVTAVERGEDGRLSVAAKGGEFEAYDLVTVATGLHSPALKAFEKLGDGYVQPVSTQTFIREYRLGQATIDATLGNAMHVFLLNVPRLEFAALIPKGDYVTFCMLGEDIDEPMVRGLLENPVVAACLPDDWRLDLKACQCLPRIAVCGTAKPYADRLLFVGDCGVTRLYKDGIGAAYRTAKAAATAAVFEGIAEEDFRRHYEPACERIRKDNAIGKLSFAATGVVQKLGFARLALVEMTRTEQADRRLAPRMSTVMWDLFTGSAPYRDIFLGALHPAFIGRFTWNLLRAIVPGGRRPARV